MRRELAGVGGSFISFIQQYVLHGLMLFSHVYPVLSTSYTKVPAPCRHNCLEGTPPNHLVLTVDVFHRCAS